MMTRITKIGVLAVLFHFTNQLYCQDRYRLCKEIKLGNYNLMHFTHLKDSVLVIVPDKIPRSRVVNSIDTLIKNPQYSKINKLSINGKLYWFVYKMPSINKNMEISVGGSSPGKLDAERVINSYLDYPILIDKI